MFTTFKFSPHNLLRLFSFQRLLFAFCFLFSKFTNEWPGQYNKQTWKRSDRRMEKVTVLHSILYISIRYKKRIIMHSLCHFLNFIFFQFFISFSSWTLAFLFKGSPMTIVTTNLYLYQVVQIFFYFYFEFYPLS